jgi:transposase
MSRDLKALREDEARKRDDKAKQKAKTLKLHRDGLGTGQISARLGIAVSTVRDWLKEQGLKPNPEET